MKVDEIQPVLEAEGFKAVEAAGPFAMYEREATQGRPFAQVILFLPPGEGVAVFFRVDATGMMSQRIFHFLRSGELLDLETVVSRLGKPEACIVDLPDGMGGPFIIPGCAAVPREIFNALQGDGLLTPCHGALCFPGWQLAKVNSNEDRPH